MTSWHQLEAYLQSLLKKVDGTAYVLRGSGGRYLAPRPPPQIKRQALIAKLLRELRTKKINHDSPPDDDPVGSAVRKRQREIDQIVALIEGFKRHAAVLDDVAGIDFVKKGPGKRYMHRRADLPFIAERFLSSYLLIIGFRDVGAVDAQGVVLALERARATICDMLAGLPPDGDGDEAISNAMRWR